MRRVLERISERDGGWANAAEEARVSANTVEECAREVDLREVGESVRLTTVRGQERLELALTLRGRLD